MLNGMALCLRSFVLMLVIAISPIGAQQIRTLTRSTAIAGANDSAVVLMSDSASRTRITTFAELFKRPNGSLTRPSYSFALDSNTGITRQIASSVSIIGNGVLLARFEGGGVPRLTMYNSTVFNTGHAGTAASPSLLINNNPGFYEAATNELGISTQGVQTFRIAGGGAATLTGGAGNMTLVSGTGANRTLTLQTTNSGGTATTALTLNASQQSLHPDGTSALPSISFSSSTGTGLLHFGPNTLGISTAGTRRWDIDATGLYPVVSNTYTIGADLVRVSRLYLADTLNTSGKIRATALTAAAGTPNSVCMNATTKEMTENAATSCVVSSRRFKKNIAPLSPVTARRLVQRLKPVTFTYRDGGREAVGLIAEDAAIADERLVSRDEKGRAHSVNYEQVTILLLSVVQRQQQQIDSLIAAAKKP